MQLIAKEHGNVLVFHGTTCGMHFPDLAKIHEWRGPNPLIEISKPLGLNLVYLILHELDRLVKEK